MAAATSIGPPRRRTNQATTAIWPTNIAAKMNRPHSAVPQNFQIRGGDRSRMTAAAAAAETSELRESIKGFQVLVVVMPGLVPGIHVFLRSAAAKTWMAGTRPGFDRRRQSGCGG